MWKRFTAHFSHEFWNLLFSGLLGSVVAGYFFTFRDASTGAVLVAYIFVLLFYVSRRRRRRLESLLSKRANYDLARTTLQKTSAVLKSRLKSCYAQRELFLKAPRTGAIDAFSHLSTESSKEEFDEGRNRRKLIYTTLSMICEQFSRDTFGQELLKSQEDEADRWPQDFFKATYYDKVEEEGGTYLMRVEYVYPPGLTPRDESQRRRLTPEDAGVMYYVAQSGEMRTLKDIRNEEERKEKGWVNFYNLQHERYRSMAVVPVRWDLGVGGRKTIGIMTIDTGRPGYFQDDTAYKAFLSDLLSPYTALLALAWEDEQIYNAARGLAETFSRGPSK
jgi:hypothetical protein